MKHNKHTDQYTIYILECVNGCYYTGFTTDIERRYLEHKNGSSKCKYTRSFPPIKIAACWIVQSDNVSLALKIEKIIKRLSKKEKAALIAMPESLCDIVPRNCEEGLTLKNDTMACLAPTKWQPQTDSI